MMLSERIAAIPERRKRELISIADRMIPYIQDEMKRTLGVQGDRKHRSKPGEPPRRQTGHLQRLAYARYYISTSPWELRIKFGSDAPYFRYLQDGTPTLAPRPSIEPTIERIRPQIQRLLAQNRSGY